MSRLDEMNHLSEISLLIYTFLFLAARDAKCTKTRVFFLHTKAPEVHNGQNQTATDIEHGR